MELRNSAPWEKPPHSIGRLSAEAVRADVPEKLRLRDPVAGVRGYAGRQDHHQRAQPNYPLVGWRMPLDTH